MQNYEHTIPFKIYLTRPLERNACTISKIYKVKGMKLIFIKLNFKLKSNSECL